MSPNQGSREFNKCVSYVSPNTWAQYFCADSPVGFEGAKIKANYHYDTVDDCNAEINLRKVVGTAMVCKETNNVWLQTRCDATEWATDTCDLAQCGGACNVLGFATKFAKCTKRVGAATFQTDVCVGASGTAPTAGDSPTTVSGQTTASGQTTSQDASGATVDNTPSSATAATLSLATLLAVFQFSA